MIHKTHFVITIVEQGIFYKSGLQYTAVIHLYTTTFWTLSSYIILRTRDRQSVRGLTRQWQEVTGPSAAVMATDKVRHWSPRFVNMASCPCVLPSHLLVKWCPVLNCQFIKSKPFILYRRKIRKYCLWQGTRWSL